MPAANELASRRVRPSCDVNAPTAANTAMGTVTLSPYSTVSAAPKATSWFRPASSVSAVVPKKMTPTAPSKPAMVAAVARAGRVEPASMSCHRPASSSPRSTRVAAKIAHTAPIVERNTKHL